MAVHRGRPQVARTRDDRLEARITPEQGHIIARAAAAAGVSKSAFVVGAVMDHASQLLRDEHLTVLASEFAQSFQLWLDEPAQVIPDLKRVVTAPDLPHQ